jgi:hypothetical protein
MHVPATKRHLSDVERRVVAMAHASPGVYHARMGERELREKYGGKLAKAINRAIRAEIPGGNEALDRLTQLAGPARHSGWKDRSGNPTPEAVAYHKHQREVIERMEATIRRTWNIESPPQAAGKRPAKRRNKQPRNTTGRRSHPKARRPKDGSSDDS